MGNPHIESASTLIKLALIVPSLTVRPILVYINRCNVCSSSRRSRDHMWLCRQLAPTVLAISTISLLPHIICFAGRVVACHERTELAVRHIRMAGCGHPGAVLPKVCMGIT